MGKSICFNFNLLKVITIYFKCFEIINCYFKIKIHKNQV